MLKDMKTQIFRLGILYFLFVLTSCIFDSSGETIKGRYNVLWIDTHANRSICYAAKNGELGGSQKVGAFINELGFNDNYIIAKRIYFNPFEKMNKPNYDSVSYYIIDMTKETEYKDDDVFGPFNGNEFKKKKVELGISELEFSKTYHE